LRTFFDVDHDDGVVRRFRLDGLDFLPPQILPVPDTKQLLPNHKLDLSTYHISRYWPLSKPAEISLDDAAVQIQKMLRAAIKAPMRRSGAVVALSGGYDSRTLLACTEPFRAKLQFYTCLYPGIAPHDVIIPRRLARTFRLDWQLLPYAPTDVVTNRVLDGNVLGTYFDKSAPLTSMMHNVAKARYCLEGVASEVLRCFYYSNGKHPASLDGKALARFCHWGGDAAAVEACEDWFRETREVPVPSLDLFYWEIRIGIWGAVESTCRQPLVETAPPFNCRRILELGLGVDVRFRRAPYLLHKRICELADPPTLRFEFNATRREQLRKSVRAIPSRMKRRLGWI